MAYEHMFYEFYTVQVIFFVKLLETISSK